MVSKEEQTKSGVKICRVKLNISEQNHISAVKLRGFCGNLFIEDVEFHHHSERSYHYPLVQYKRVNGELIVVGLQDYARILMNKMSNVDKISTLQGDFKVESHEISLQSCSIRNIPCCYEFATPWLPLNETNYSAFMNLGMTEQKAFLENILISNTLSCLKGLGIFVDYRISSQIATFRSFRVHAHGNVFEGFTARFSLNVELPDFIGLGKSVSKGYGTIRRAL